MGWITSSGYLNQSQMENNADIIISYLQSQNVNENTISAILGNMQAESTLNPTLNEVGGSGYGLVQWTPVSVLQNHCSNLGLSGYTNGSVQLRVLLSEIRGTNNNNEWYSTQAFINNYTSSGATSDMVGITGEQFLNNSMNWSPQKLAILFMACYERPSTDPDVNHYLNRQVYAGNWYNYSGENEYTPRLNDTGILGNPYWYGRNPFYQAGYGLPNCTCYAWGRFWEIADPNNDYINRPALSTSDAGLWYGYTQDGYERGQTPQLGAVVCFDKAGDSGHVAIVEEILSNGDIVTSNSAWGSTYFYMKTYEASNGYNFGSYRFQGFIYNPYASQGKKKKKKKKKHFNFVLFDKRRRDIKYG